METKPYSQLYPLCSLQTLIQIVHCREDTEPSTDSTLSIIVVGLGIPKIDQEAIPKELSDVTVKAGNHF
jgi:hypothetical protein